MTKQEKDELIRLLKKLSDTTKDIQIKFKATNFRSLLENK